MARPIPAAVQTLVAQHRATLLGIAAHLSELGLDSDTRVAVRERLERSADDVREALARAGYVETA